MTEKKLLKGETLFHQFTKQLFVSKYELYLPDKKLLAGELEKLLTDE